MPVIRLSTLKAFLLALPLILLAAAIFAFADNLGPVAGAAAPVIVLLGLVAFFYLSGRRD